MTVRILLTCWLFISILSGQKTVRSTIQVGLKSTGPYTLAQVWKLDAKYVDRPHGASFDYPSVWRSNAQYGYWPPTLTQASPIAAFSYQEGGFPRQQIIGPYTRTNLEGFGIVYSALPAASDVACQTRAAELARNNSAQTPKASRLTLDGILFAMYSTGGGGMSQSISEKLYAGFAANTCYLFDTGVAVASLADVKPLSMAQSQEIEKHLFEIIQSVTIRPGKR